MTMTTHLCFWEVPRTQAQVGVHPAIRTVVVQGTLDKGAVLEQDMDLEHPFVRVGSWYNLR